jgi:hypothetical protein
MMPAVEHERPASGRQSDEERGSAARTADILRFGAAPLFARLVSSAEFLVAVKGKISGWSGQAAYLTALAMTTVAFLQERAGDEQ